VGGMTMLPEGTFFNARCFPRFLLNTSFPTPHTLHTSHDPLLLVLAIDVDLNSTFEHPTTTLDRLTYEQG